MLLGAFLNRIDILEDKAMSSISKILINVGIPAMIIGSLSGSAGITGKTIALTVVLSFFCYALMFGVGVALSYLLKVEKQKKPFYWLLSMMGNVGFIGYPMVIAILGIGALLTASVFNIFYNILFFSLGLYLTCMYQEDGVKGKFDYKKLINPSIIATLISVILFLLDIKMPVIIDKTANMVGDLTPPLGVLVVGASLNKLNLKKALTNYRVIALGLVKMTVVPLCVAFACKWLGITGTPAMVAVVLVGMPSATSNVILANQYNPRNIEIASETVVLSTLMLIATIPVLAYAVSIVG